jgi:copper chaperone CopZ
MRSQPDRAARVPAVVAMGRITVRVQGMGCPRCIREVTGILRDVPGVVTVTADVAASVVCLSGTMTAGAVLDALTARSYVAEVL